LDSKINFIASLALSKELINSQQPLILNSNRGFQVSWAFM